MVRCQWFCGGGGGGGGGGGVVKVAVVLVLWLMCWWWWWWWWCYDYHYHHHHSIINTITLSSTNNSINSCAPNKQPSPLHLHFKNAATLSFSHVIHRCKQHQSFFCNLSNPLPMMQQPLQRQGLLTVEASLPHSDKRQSVVYYGQAISPMQ